MSLIGVSLLGNSFIQDSNPNWIKIDNIVVGESSIYGYSTVNSNGDIGSLLNKLSQDPKVVCLVYNWSSNTGYVKTGFNLSASTDYKVSSGYTTFILKNKVQYYYKPNIQPTPTPTLTKFVKYDNTKGNFVLNNNKFVPVGFNAYWLGYTENYNYPNTIQVDEMFDVALKMSATVIRSHTLGFSSGSPNSLRPSNNYLNADAWKAIDYAFYKAKQTGVKLICPMTDAYNYFNGNYGDYCKTRGIDKNQFFTNQYVRNDFKQYINQWLNHTNSYTGIQIKNSPELFIIELGNELGNIRPDSNSTILPTQDWISDISKYIKSLDANHLVMSCSDECLGSSTSNDFNINSIDVYSSHFYGQDYNRINYGANYSAGVGKPYIIGEASSGFNSDFTSNILSNSNVKGIVFWSMYPHQNGPGSNLVIHDDGFTLHYPEDYDRLLNWTNYFRQAQNLPKLNSLN